MKAIFSIVLLVLIVVIIIGYYISNENVDIEKEIYYYKHIKIADLPAEFEFDGKHYDIGVAYDVSNEPSRSRFIYTPVLPIGIDDYASYCLIRFDGGKTDFKLITIESALEIALQYSIEIPETPRKASFPFFKQWGYLIILFPLYLAALVVFIFIAKKRYEDFHFALIGSLYIGLPAALVITQCAWFVTTVINNWPFY